MDLMLNFRSMSKENSTNKKMKISKNINQTNQLILCDNYRRIQPILKTSNLTIELIILT